MSGKEKNGLLIGCGSARNDDHASHDGSNGIEWVSVDPGGGIDFRPTIYALVQDITDGDLKSEINSGAHHFDFIFNEANYYFPGSRLAGLLSPEGVFASVGFSFVMDIALANPEAIFMLSRREQIYVRGGGVERLNEAYEYFVDRKKFGLLGTGGDGEDIKFIEGFRCSFTSMRIESKFRDVSNYLLSIAAHYRTFIDIRKSKFIRKRPNDVKYETFYEKLCDALLSKEMTTVRNLIEELGREHPSAFIGSSHTLDNLNRKVLEFVKSYVNAHKSEINKQSKPVVGMSDKAPAAGAGGSVGAGAGGSVGAGAGGSVGTGRDVPPAAGAVDSVGTGRDVPPAAGAGSSPRKKVSSNVFFSECSEPRSTTNNTEKKPPTLGS